MKVAGKVALITGGARGLGRAFARSLLKEGGRVCILDVETGAGIETADAFNKEFGPGSCEFVKCNVASQEEMEYAFRHAVATFGGLDIVVNNAGIHNEKKWEDTVAINLTAVIRGSFLAVENMKVQNGGRGGLIINVASLAGIDIWPMAPVYSASKFGCVGFSRNLGIIAMKDPSYSGIRVSCFCPGFTKTDMFQDEVLTLFGDDPISKISKKSLEIVGVMEIEDVARAFMALVEDDRAHAGVVGVTREGPTYLHPRHLKGSKL